MREHTCERSFSSTKLDNHFSSNVRLAIHLLLGDAADLFHQILVNAYFGNRRRSGLANRLFSFHKCGRIRSHGHIALNTTVVSQKATDCAARLLSLLFQRDVCF